MNSIEEPPTPPPLAEPNMAERMFRFFVPIFGLLSLAAAFLTLRGLENMWQALTLLAAIPLAWMFSDLLTGMTHWFLDTYGDEHTPILGETLIKPFRMHHHHPTYMVQYDDTDSIAISAFAVTPIQIFACYISSLAGWWTVLGGALAVSIVGTVGTNLFHKWAHMSEPPRYARLLQRLHLVLPVGEHDRHHISPHDCSYCITNGWLNPFLDRIHFWRGMERTLGMLGIKPNSELYASTNEPS